MKKLFYRLRKKLFAEVLVKTAALEDNFSFNNTGKESQLIIKNQYKSIPAQDLLNIISVMWVFAGILRIQKMVSYYLFFQ